MVVCVFARISEWSVPPERQDEALRAAEEHIGPALSKQLGYCGDLLLGYRHSGKMLTVTLWEDEQAMHATDEASHWFRTYGAWQTGGTAESTGHYEVFRAQTIDELPLEWFLAPGMVIDATDRADGEALSLDDVLERRPRLLAERDTSS